MGLVHSLGVLGASSLVFCFASFGFDSPDVLPPSESDYHVRCLKVEGEYLVAPPIAEVDSTILDSAAMFLAASWLVSPSDVGAWRTSPTLLPVDLPVSELFEKPLIELLPYTEKDHRLENIFPTDGAN